MTNDEPRMTKECLMTKHDATPVRHSSFGFRHSFVIGASSFVIFTALTVLLSPRANATSPRLTGLTPVGAQRGSEVELRLSGARLDDTQEIIFYEPGIQVVSIDAAKTNVIKAQLKIASDCRLG